MQQNFGKKFLKLPKTPAISRMRKPTIPTFFGGSFSQTPPEPRQETLKGWGFFKGCKNPTVPSVTDRDSKRKDKTQLASSRSGKPRRFFKLEAFSLREKAKGAPFDFFSLRERLLGTRRTYICSLADFFSFKKLSRIEGS